MYPLKRNTAITVPVFIHDEAGDPVTGLSDGDFTKRISKNGGAFGAMTVSLAEMEYGFYSLPIDTGHADTLGLLTIILIHGSTQQAQLQYRVHARLPDDHAFPLVSARPLDVRATGEVGIDLDNTQGTLDKATQTTGFNDPSEASLVAAVWTQSLPESFAGGTAGYVIGQYIDASLTTIDANVDLVLADTNELQTDWANGGRLDLIIDAILVDTNELQGDWTNGGRLDLILDAILADSNELQTDWADGGRLDLLLDTATGEEVLAPIATSLAGMDFTPYNIMQTLFDRFYEKNTQTSNAQVTFSSSGDTFASRVTSDDGTTQTIGKAT